jgi:microcystin-dependent protein
MGTPYIGEIRMFAGNFPPAGWEFCQGQLLPISEYDVLFALIGTTYGGDGQSTFALPNLMGRIPLHQGSGPGLSTQVIGQMAGFEQVTLTASQIPAHNHTIWASGNNASSSNPANNVYAVTSGFDAYFDGLDVNNNLAASVLNPVGGSQPHENMQPFLCISFIISLFGIFPSPS